MEGSTQSIIIAVMGSTGSGISTFINLASGSSLRAGNIGNAASCNTSNVFVLDGVPVTLIDTPGFDNTTTSDTDILKMITSYLTTSYKSSRKLSGIVYLHRITDHRMGGISRKNFSMFRRLCGDDTLKNVVIVTNMWSQEITDVELEREAQLQTDPLLFEPVLKKGATMLRHYNTEESAQSIICHLIHNHPEVLQTQKDTVLKGLESDPALISDAIFSNEEATLLRNNSVTEEPSQYSIRRLVQDMPAVLQTRIMEDHTISSPTVRTMQCTACGTIVGKGAVPPGAIVYCSRLCQKIDSVASVILGQCMAQNGEKADASLSVILVSGIASSIHNQQVPDIFPRSPIFFRYVQQVFDYLDNADAGDAELLKIKERLRLLSLGLYLDNLVPPSWLVLKDVKCADKINFLGGGFSDVFRGTFGTKAAALKRPRIFTNATQADKDAMRKAIYYEASIWATLTHPNILQVFGISETVFKPFPCIVCPWMENGSLRSFLSKLISAPEYRKETLSEMVAKWLLELAFGLQYLHAREIVHGDLRSDNVLVDGNGHAHLADFGLAVLANETSQRFGSLRGGNERWLAPELLAPELFNTESIRPTFASDVYSYGCVVIELFTNRPPFNNQFTLSHLVSRKVAYDKIRPGRPRFHGEEQMSTALWSIVCRCWEHQPSERPTANELTVDIPLACPDHV